jgi:hypothetical protein
MAVSVLALLGFGVLVGAGVGAGGGASALVMRPSPAARTLATTPTANTLPPTTPQATPSAASGEGGNETGGEETEEGSGKQEGAAKSKEGSGKSKPATKLGGPGGGQGARGGSEGPASGLPPIDHVFLIVLSEAGYGATFGAGPSAPYLSKMLPSEGELIESYYAVAGGEPAGAIGLISGQGPTEQTLQGCPLYADVLPGSAGADDQTLGSGCVYPSTTLTLANQLEGAGKTWKSYVEGSETGAIGSCPHPQLDSGYTPQSGSGANANGYESRRNPFVYFHSLIDGSACEKDDVGIGQLAPDLSSAARTPSLAYIAPGACDDGSTAPCSPGAPAGVGPAEAFLRKVMGEIEASTAYKQGGLIAITSDQAPQSGPDADSSGCCVNTPYPNLPASTLTAATGSQGATPAAGGRVGLLLISKYVKPGSLNALGEYDHYSLLLSIEQLFDLKPLGYAGAKGLLPFDTSVYNARAR